MMKKIISFVERFSKSFGTVCKIVSDRKECALAVLQILKGNILGNIAFSFCTFEEISSFLASFIYQLRL